MTCKSCGAPVTNGICEYCGTLYATPTDAYIQIHLDIKEAELERLKTELMTQTCANSLYLQTAKIRRSYGY